MMAHRLLLSDRLATLQSKTPSQTGTFWDYKGGPIEW